MKRRNLGFVGVFLAGVLVSVVVSGGAVLAAGGSFNDVPSTHPFSKDIESVADACITGGYPDGGFHPQDPVSRQAMAAFVNRSMARTIKGKPVGGAFPSFGATAPTANSPWVTIASVTVTIPDLPGTCDVPVKLDGYATAYTNYSLDDTCHQANICNAEVGLMQGTTIGANQMARITSNSWGGAFAPTDVFTQRDGTKRTYHLVVRGLSVKPGRGYVYSNRTIVATTFPQQATGA